MRTNFFFGKIQLGRVTAFAFAAAMIFAVVLLLQAANPADAATTFTVNSTDDDPAAGPTDDAECTTAAAGECTLRAAIQEANNTRGADTINFAISGAGPHTISPTSDLPPIEKPVTINGYSQPGSSPNTNPQGAINASPLIELDGTNAGIANGLLLNGTGASNSVIRGLVINNFFSFGIYLLGGTGYKIEGNFIGTDPSGTAAEPNNNAVTILASNSTLGGTTPDKRNLLSGNKSHGVQVGGQGGKIQGNLIGTKANGTEALGNGVPSGGNGMSIGSSSNIIGDSDPSDGIANAANTIAFNKGDGVGISGTSATGNRILSNSIFSNGSTTNDLGIDLSPDGVTENDGDDPATSKPDPDKDTGPNNLQNYPVITSAQTFGNFTSISGTLESTPSTRKKKRTFIIQFYSSPQDPPDSGKNDPSGYGEGQTFIGQIQVTTNRQGKATFSFAPPQVISEERIITATATNKRTGDTSEFSQARVVEGPVIGP